MTLFAGADGAPRRRADQQEGLRRRRYQRRERPETVACARATVSGSPPAGLCAWLSPRLQTSGHLPSFRSGDPRSRSIRRRISAKSDRRTATLGQLEHDVTAVAYDPGADLHQLIAQRGQRPLLDLPRRSERPQEVGQVCRPGRRTQRSQIAELVEDEQGMVAVAAEVAIPGRALLLPTRLALGAVHACRPSSGARISLTGGQAGAKQAVDQQFARWVMLHVQSNPLPICTRPRVLIKGKRT